MRIPALLGLFVLALAGDLFGQGAPAPGGRPVASPQWRDPRLRALFTYGGAVSEATDSLRQGLRAAGYSFESAPNFVVGFDVHYRYYGRWAAGLVAVRSTRHMYGEPLGLSGAVVEADHDVSSIGLVLSRSFVVKPLRQGQIEVSAGFGPAWHAVRTRDSLPSASRDRFETSGYIAQAAAQAVGGQGRIKLLAQGGAQYRKVGRGDTGPLSAQTGFPDVPRIEASFDDLTIRIALGVGF